MSPSLFKKLISTRNLRLVGYFKSLIIIKEIKKLSIYFSRLGKNQLIFEILEKILKLTYLKSQWKIVFPHILSHLPRPLQDVSKVGLEGRGGSRGYIGNISQKWKCGLHHSCCPASFTPSHTTKTYNGDDTLH